MAFHSNLTHEQTPVRLFRMVAVLAAVRVAASVILSVSITIMVQLTGSYPISTTFATGHTILTYLLEYGIPIGMFALLIAAAKHLSAKSALFKTGSIIGVVGASGMIGMLLLSLIYSYSGYVPSEDGVFSEGWLILIIANPFSQKVLPWIPAVGLALCAVCFFFHESRAVKTTAVILVAIMGAELLLGIVLSPFNILTAALLSALGLAVKILPAVLFATLAKYYKQAGAEASNSPALSDFSTSSNHPASS